MIACSSTPQKIATRSCEISMITDVVCLLALRSSCKGHTDTILICLTGTGLTCSTMLSLPSSLSLLLRWLWNLLHPAVGASRGCSLTLTENFLHVDHQVCPLSFYPTCCASAGTKACTTGHRQCPIAISPAAFFLQMGGYTLSQVHL